MFNLVWAVIILLGGLILAILAILLVIWMVFVCVSGPLFMIFLTLDCTYRLIILILKDLKEVLEMLI